MKKSLLILMFISFMFLGCDSKPAIDGSVIAKKTSQTSNLEFVS